MSKIIMLATGGTVAGVNTKGDAYVAGVLPPKYLLKPIEERLLELDEDILVEAYEIASVDSKNMNETIWKKLRGEVQKHLANDEVSGVVITHGTDTLAETAFFLEYTLKTEKPVVLTGAMRPATALSFDGADNLFRAILTAASPLSKNRGALVVINNEIHGATDVIKHHKNNVAAFVSPNTGPLGLVIDDSPIFFFCGAKLKHKIYDFKEDAEFPYVPIITAYAGDDGRLVLSAAKEGAKGIVYAGFGAGTYSDAVGEKLARAAKEGVKIMIAGAPPKGRAEKTKYMSAGFLSPQKARILLMLEIISASYTTRS